MDLICANVFDNTLSVLTNNGTGVFGTNATLTVGREPASVVAADVNGDGQVDLICANVADSTLTVLMNVSGVGAHFTGDGSGLNNLNVNAANLTGQLGLAQLPAGLLTNNASGVALSGSFTGDGSGLTGLPVAPLPANVLTNGRNASGIDSIALGQGTTASGDYSTALGFFSIASGGYSTALGYSTTASGDYSTALGDFPTASGYASTALGYRTAASGDYSTALGINTTATNIASTALGGSTTASGDYSTALGSDTTASGDYSTAMGSYTAASGDYSTALGYYTTASGNISTALGYNTTASGTNSTALGYYAQATNDYSFVWADGQLAYFTSTTNNEFSVRAGGGVRLVTGGAGLTVDGQRVLANGASGDGSGLTNLNFAQLTGTIPLAQLPAGVLINGSGASGTNSTALGLNTLARGQGSTALGYGTLASGTNSIAMGYGTLASSFAAAALGEFTTASGNYSTAMGYDTTASGQSSTALGYDTMASGFAATALGEFTTASGTNSTAMGFNTTASGNDSTALGNSTIASGNGSTAMGNGAEAMNDNSFVWADGQDWGFNSTTTNQFSVRAGGGVRFVTGGAGMTVDNQRVLINGSGASGLYSLALGNATTASAQYSTAMGSGTTASGYYSTAMGNNTTASGLISTALGFYSTASGYYSTAMGDGALASGWSSTAMGTVTTASGQYSTAMGCGAQATDDSSFVWADGYQNRFFASTTTNEFSVSAHGGVRLVTGGAGLTVDGQRVLTNGASMTGSFTGNGGGLTNLTLAAASGSQAGALSSADWTTFNNKVGGSGTANYVPQFTASGTVGNSALFSDPSGNVGIGTASPSYTLHVNGSVAGTSAYNNLSDARLKKDVQPIGDALAIVEALRGVTYNWNQAVDPSLKLDERNHVGFLAQEVERVLPQAVSTANDARQTKSVAYSEVIPVLNEAIKQQQSQIATLQAENEELKARLDALEAKVDK